ncbi:hypothetical protein AC1031_009829 [Aphanomyces cochlioides]|nr:hypothetical protein AC1031_009829 [Aphanomyces cochlioides]
MHQPADGAIFTRAVSKSAKGVAMATKPSSFDAVRRKCLDAAWVANVSATLSVDPQARDSQNRRVYPWLRPALQSARFKINDNRQYLPTAYQPKCFGQGELLHGVGETVSASSGNQVNQGSFQGTFTMEWNGWPSHALMSSTLSVLLQEVLGYDVTYFETASGALASQRMSSVGLGTCVPTHYNAEVWAASKLQVLNVYANESTSRSNGYDGQAGWFTLTANVNEASLGPNSTKGSFRRPYSADFWREFTFTTDLVQFYSVQKTNLSQIVAPKYCPDGTMGCQNGCSKSPACKLAEAQNQTCLVVLMMTSDDNPGYLQAAISNNNIPAYFCFAGYDGVQTAVVNAMQTNSSVTFYHYEPDLFHMQYAGKLKRIALPRPIPKIVATDTGTFGDNTKTNPVSVDFAPESLKKYFANLLNQDTYLANFLNKVSLSQVDINNLLTALKNDATVANAPFAAAACNWVKSNYATWKMWLDPLPLCSFQSHMQYTIAGCDNNASSTMRSVSFNWTVPDPTNASLPYQCDGGSAVLPPPLLSSRSCAWFQANVNVWSTWIVNKPICDATFYNYTISPCTSDASRDVIFSWLLPQPTNPARSLECIGGVNLPPNATVQCDYVPTSSSAYAGMTAFAVTVLILLLMCAAVVALFRNRPVIRRSQWQLLVIMVLGGVCFCVYVILGAGEPSTQNCAGRPVTVVLGFSFVFGTLLVKGLRVYWIFANKQLRKVKVTLVTIVESLLLILAIDAAILIVWFIVDFPQPTTTIKAATEFVGQVDHVACKSSSFIFTALLIFWKAVITLGGVYVSYLIRSIDSDFQESVWIFASSCVVFVVALILLVLAYLVQLPPAVSYSFESILLLLGTTMVMALMLGPKFHKLNASDYSSSKVSGSNNGGTKHSVIASSNEPSHHATGHIAGRKSSESSMAPT